MYNMFWVVIACIYLLYICCTMFSFYNLSSTTYPMCNMFVQYFPVQHILYKKICTIVSVQHFPVRNLMYNTFLHKIVCTRVSSRTFHVQHFMYNIFVYNISVLHAVHNISCTLCPAQHVPVQYLYVQDFMRHISLYNLSVQSDPV